MFSTYYSYSKGSYQPNLTFSSQINSYCFNAGLNDLLCVCERCYILRKNMTFILEKSKQAEVGGTLVFQC